MNVEDNAFLALELPNGAIGWLHASWTEWKNTFRLEVSMTQARADIVGLGGSYGTERLVLHEMKPEMGPPVSTEHSFTEDESWRLELQDFIDALHGSEGFGATSSDALAVWSVVEGAYSS
jgi:predicted dehydrogenase